MCLNTLLAMIADSTGGALGCSSISDETCAMQDRTKRGVAISTNMQGAKGVLRGQARGRASGRDGSTNKVP